MSGMDPRVSFEVQGPWGWAAGAATGDSSERGERRPERGLGVKKKLSPRGTRRNTGELLLNSVLASESRCVRDDRLTKARWSRADHAAEDAGEVALIGEAALDGDGGEWPLGIAQQFAGGSHLQALLVFAGRAILDLAEDARQVDGMNSSFVRQVAHAKAVAEALVQMLFHAAKPARGGLLGRFEFGDGPDQFEDKRVEHQRIGGLRLERRVEAKAGPKDGSRTAIEGALPRQAALDFQFAQLRLAQL